MRRVNWFSTPVDANGLVPVTGSVSINGSGATASQVQGNVAAAVADSGNPVKTGGKYNATQPIYTDGQRGNTEVDTRGNTKVTIVGINGVTGAGANAISYDAIPNTQQSLNTIGFTYVFDGSGSSGWDRVRSVQAATSTGLGVVAVGIVPYSTANSALTPTAATAVTGQRIFSTSACNLYGLNVCTGATPGYLMVYNSATSIADGASTPVKVIACAASASFYERFNIPVRFTTGLTCAFSTTGPFAKTESNTVFMSVDFI